MRRHEGEMHIRWAPRKILMISTHRIGTAVLLSLGATLGIALGNTAGHDDYRIGPEDMLDIAVWNNTTISRTVPVRPDGKISLPLVNDVQAAGLTPMELRDQIASRLAEYMPSPEVSVIVREVNSLKVSVVGQVRTPGRYSIRTPTSVLEAIALAGGFNEFAKTDRILILRSNGGTTQRISFSYDNAASRSGEQKDVLLERGDVVVVP